MQEKVEGCDSPRPCSHVSVALCAVPLTCCELFPLDIPPALHEALKHQRERRTGVMLSRRVDDLGPIVVMQLADISQTSAFQVGDGVNPAEGVTDLQPVAALL
jgi:hypothetical protein